MVSFKDWLKMLIIIPITWLHSLSTLLEGKSNINIGIYLASKILGQTNLDNEKLFIFMVENILYLIIFHLLYGNLISENFRYSSVYVFSRIKSRKKWFYRISLKLLSICFLYTFIFLFTNLVICDIGSTKSCNLETFYIFSILLIMLTMILLSTTMIINLISIRFGNSIGFLTVYILLLLFLFLALQSPKSEFIRKYPLVLILNPATAMSFNFVRETFLQAGVIIYYAILNLIILLTGSNYINHFDIALSDAESK